LWQSVAWRIVMGAICDRPTARFEDFPVRVTLSTKASTTPDHPAR
jgi:hypothetical protein